MCYGKKGEKCWGNRYTAKSTLSSRVVTSLWAVRSILANHRWQGACDERKKSARKKRERQVRRRTRWAETNTESWAHGCGAVPSVQLSESTWMSNVVRSACSELRCSLETVVRGAGWELISNTHKEKKYWEKKRDVDIYIRQKVIVCRSYASAATSSMCPCAASVVWLEQLECQDSRHLKFRIRNRNKGLRPKRRAGGWGDQDKNKWSHLILLGFIVTAVWLFNCLNMEISVFNKNNIRNVFL